MVENFAVAGRNEGPKFALLAAREGARRSGVRRAGERNVLLAIRTPRLTVDIVYRRNLKSARCQPGEAHSIGRVGGWS